MSCQTDGAAINWDGGNDWCSPCGRIWNEVLNMLTLRLLLDVLLRCQEINVKNVASKPLVVQWLRIQLPKQGTWVWSLESGNIPHAIRKFKPINVTNLNEPLLHNKTVTAIRRLCTSTREVPQQLKKPESNNVSTAKINQLI